MSERKSRAATEKEKSGVKTTVLLPEELWEKAKLRALQDRSNLRAVIIEALEQHLTGDKPKGQGRKM